MAFDAPFAALIGGQAAVLLRNGSSGGVVGCTDACAVIFGKIKWWYCDERQPWRRHIISTTGYAYICM